MIPFNQLLMMGLMLIGGFFWALININSYPLVVERTTEAKIGPLILGGIIDLTSFVATFLFTASAYVFAFLCIAKTK